MLDSAGNNVGLIPTFVLGTPPQIGLAKESKQNAQLEQLEEINEKLDTTTTPLNVNVVNQTSGNSTNQYTLGTVSTGDEQSNFVIGTDLNNGERKGLSFDGQSLIVKDFQAGAPNNGVPQLNIGSGTLGWLSGIYKRLTDAFTNNLAPYHKITDGVFNATIKNSSTSPLATDTSLVTSLSPNGNTVKIGETIFINSPGNTSNVQLAAGASFVGTVVNLLTGKSLIVSANSNLAYTVNITQYNDALGTQNLGVTTFTRAANIPVNEAVQMNGDYARVSITNTGATTTTVFFVNTYFGDMQPTPTALTNNGNFKVALLESIPTGTNLIGAVNSTQINGNAYNTGAGVFGTGTQRIVLANRNETQVGSIETSADIAIGAGQRIKSILFNNITASVVYLQIFNKASALALNDIPLNGLIIRVPINSTLDKNTGDFGEAGILYGATIRIGLSSTFATYTPIAPANTSINIITVV
jgi:hypothetical protein